MSPRTSRAFTVIELLVVISILVLLMAILLPSMRRAREVTWRTLDSAHLHQFTTACFAYAGDNFTFYPVGRRERAFQQINADDLVWFNLDTWETLRDDYALSEESTMCLSVGRQKWYFKPRPFGNEYETHIGWIYWGNRAEYSFGGDEYKFPVKTSTPNVTSRTLANCMHYDAATMGYSWGSFMPHVKHDALPHTLIGRSAGYFPTGVVPNPGPEGMANAYTDGSAGWVDIGDMETYIHADLHWYDPR